MIGLSILLAVVAYVWLARFAIRRIKNRAAKYTVIAIFILVPTWDIIPGKLYFNHLCENEAGVKVYKAVELPAEYWDEKGRPKFFNEQGYLDHKILADKLDGFGGHVERYSSVFAIDKDISPVKEKSSQEVLAEVTTFLYWGGWVNRKFSPHNTAASCEFMDAPNFSRSFYGQLFRPATSSK
ncbi:MAG: hypothetical protein ACYC2R_15905 [Burkholderiales bacterium]